MWCSVLSALPCSMLLLSTFDVCHFLTVVRVFQWGWIKLNHRLPHCALPTQLIIKFSLTLNQTRWRATLGFQKAVFIPALTSKAVYHFCPLFWTLEVWFTLLSSLALCLAFTPVDSTRHFAFNFESHGFVFCLCCPTVSALMDVNVLNMDFKGNIDIGSMPCQRNTLMKINQNCFKKSLPFLLLGADCFTASTLPVHLTEWPWTRHFWDVWESHRDREMVLNISKLKNVWLKLLVLYSLS